MDYMMKIVMTPILIENAAILIHFIKDGGSGEGGKSG